MSDDHALTGECDCEERKQATKSAMFFFWSDGGGWVFVDGPMRKLARGRTYWKISGTVDDHTGEMFVWHCCPFCGLELPQPMKSADEWRSEDGG